MGILEYARIIPFNRLRFLSYCCLVSKHCSDIFLTREMFSENNLVVLTFLCERTEYWSGVLPSPIFYYISVQKWMLSDIREKSKSIRQPSSTTVQKNCLMVWLF